MAGYDYTARIDLSSAGVQVAYGFGKERPTEWTDLCGIKSVPSMAQQPDVLDATTLAETESRKVIAGLKSAPSSTSFGVNFTNTLVKQWKEVMETYNALGNDEQMWLCIRIPKCDDAFYFTVTPSSLDVPNITVGSVIEAEVYITPTSDRKMDTPPTVIKAWTPKSTSLSGD